MDFRCTEIVSTATVTIATIEIIEQLTTPTHSNTTYSFVPEYISTATCNNVSGQISTADSTNITEYIATADITYNITGCIFTSTTVCTQSTIRVKTKQLQQSSSTQEPSMLQYSGKHIISTA